MNGECLRYTFRPGSHRHIYVTRRNLLTEIDGNSSDALLGTEERVGVSGVGRFISIPCGPIHCRGKCKTQQ